MKTAREYAHEAWSWRGCDGEFHATMCNDATASNLAVQIDALKWALNAVNARSLGVRTELYVTIRNRIAELEREAQGEPGKGGTGT